MNAAPDTPRFNSIKLSSTASVVVLNIVSVPVTVRFFTTRSLITPSPPSMVITVLVTPPSLTLKSISPFSVLF